MPTAVLTPFVCPKTGKGPHTVPNSTPSPANRETFSYGDLN